MGSSASIDSTSNDDQEPVTVTVVQLSGVDSRNYNDDELEGELSAIGIVSTHNDNKESDDSKCNNYSIPSCIVKMPSTPGPCTNQYVVYNISASLAGYSKKSFNLQVSSQSKLTTNEMLIKILSCMMVNPRDIYPKNLLECMKENQEFQMIEETKVIMKQVSRDNSRGFTPMEIKHIFDPNNAEDLIVIDLKDKKGNNPTRSRRSIVSPHAIETCNNSYSISTRIIQYLKKNRMPMMAINGKKILANHMDHPFIQVLQPFLLQASNNPIEVHIIFSSETIMCNNLMYGLYTEQQHNINNNDPNDHHNNNNNNNNFRYDYIPIRHRGLQLSLPVKVLSNFTISRVKEEACKLISKEVNWNSDEITGVGEDDKKFNKHLTPLNYRLLYYDNVLKDDQTLASCNILSKGVILELKLESEITEQKSSSSSAAAAAGGHLYKYDLIMYFHQIRENIRNLVFKEQYSISFQRLFNYCNLNRTRGELNYRETNIAIYTLLRLLTHNRWAILLNKTKVWDTTSYNEQRKQLEDAGDSIFILPALPIGLPTDHQISYEQFLILFVDVLVDQFRMFYTSNNDTTTTSTTSTSKTRDICICRGFDSDGYFECKGCYSVKNILHQNNNHIDTKYDECNDLFSSIEKKLSIWLDEKNGLLTKLCSQDIIISRLSNNNTNNRNSKNNNTNNKKSNKTNTKSKNSGSNKSNDKKTNNKREYQSPDSEEQLFDIVYDPDSSRNINIINTFDYIKLGLQHMLFLIFLPILFFFIYNKRLFKNVVRNTSNDESNNIPLKVQFLLFGAKFILAILATGFYYAPLLSIIIYHIYISKDNNSLISGLEAYIPFCITTVCVLQRWQYEIEDKSNARERKLNQLISDKYYVMDHLYYDKYGIIPKFHLDTSLFTITTRCARVVEQAYQTAELQVLELNANVIKYEPNDDYTVHNKPFSRLASGLEPEYVLPRDRLGITSRIISETFINSNSSCFSFVGTVQECIYLLIVLIHCLLPGMYRIIAYDSSFLGGVSWYEQLVSLNNILSIIIIFSYIKYLCRAGSRYSSLQQALLNVAAVADRKQSTEYNLAYYLDIQKSSNLDYWLALRTEAKQLNAHTFLTIVGSALLFDLALIITAIISIVSEHNHQLDIFNMLCIFDILILSLAVIGFLLIVVQVNNVIQTKHVEVLQQVRKELSAEMAASTQTNTNINLQELKSRETQLSYLKSAEEQIENNASNESVNLFGLVVTQAFLLQIIGTAITGASTVIGLAFHN